MLRQTNLTQAKKNLLIKNLKGYDIINLLKLNKLNFMEGCIPPMFENMGICDRCNEK